jgi:hypothetical protein
MDEVVTKECTSYDDTEVIIQAKYIGDFLHASAPIITEGSIYLMPCDDGKNVDLVATDNWQLLRYRFPSITQIGNAIFNIKRDTLNNIVSVCGGKVRFNCRKSECLYRIYLDKEDSGKGNEERSPDEYKIANEDVKIRNVHSTGEGDLILQICNNNDFKIALSRCVPIAKMRRTRKSFNGIIFQYEDINNPILVAIVPRECVLYPLDSMRVKHNADVSVGGWKIFPVAACNAILEILERYEDLSSIEIVITLSSNIFAIDIIKMGEWEWRVDGTYVGSNRPNYERIIPKSFDMAVCYSSKELCRILRSAITISSSNDCCVSITNDKDMNIAIVKMFDSVGERVIGRSNLNLISMTGDNKEIIVHASLVIKACEFISEYVIMRYESVSRMIQIGDSNGKEKYLIKSPISVAEIRVG